MLQIKIKSKKKRFMKKAKMFKKKAKRRDRMKT